MMCIRRCGHIRRLTVAARIKAHHPIFLCEHGKLIIPLATIEQMAMQHDQRMPFARRFVPQAHAVHVDEACLRFKHDILLYSATESTDDTEGLFFLCALCVLCGLRLDASL